MDKIRIVIADDNRYICETIVKYLEQYSDIEILGVANTDKEEIEMIENLKPEIVITDLMRENHKYTGLDIIKDYNKKNPKLKFLVISADEEDQVIDKTIEIGGYIKKPFFEYQIIVEELRRIKSQMEEQEDNAVLKIENINIFQKFLNLFRVRKMG